MHPVENIRGTLSRHLEGRRIVLAVCGSIGAVKSVELARELVRHGAFVVPVMTDAATRILHPDALEFATGTRPILRLTGQVEHVSLLGGGPGKAALLLVAPATANTVAKMALGIDDTPVTTCATTAFGSGVPVVVAPAMDEAMIRHPLVGDHQRTLTERLGVTWVEPLREESKAKLADVEAIVEAVIHRIAQEDGPLRGTKALVVSGATAEPVDPVRILTNASSGRSGVILATELLRLGAEVTLWQGRATQSVPAHLRPCAVEYRTHADLLDLVKATDLDFDQIWMPAAIGDYAPKPATAKIPSGRKSLSLELAPTSKVIDAVRTKAPKATLVAFKAESDGKALLKQAKDRLKRYKAQYVVANLAASFGSHDTTAHLVWGKGTAKFSGPKEEVLASIVAKVALAAKAPKSASRTGSTAKASSGSERRAGSPLAAKSTRRAASKRKAASTGKAGSTREAASRRMARRKVAK